MRLMKFFQIMGITTALALTYIHMQMQIIDLAYQGNTKEQKIKKLIEENGSATYKILMLKSASHLGVEMLNEDSGMQFADADDVMQIVSSDQLFLEDQNAQPPELAKRTNPLLNLISFGVEAEAKTSE